MPGVSVSFMNKSDGKVFGTKSDLSGKASLKVKNSELPVKLDIRYVGMQSKTFWLDSTGDYSILFPINLDFIQSLVKGDELHFIVDEFAFDQIILKQVKEKEFRMFTKKQGD